MYGSGFSWRRVFRVLFLAIAVNAVVAFPALLLELHRIAAEAEARRAARRPDMDELRRELIEIMIYHEQAGKSAESAE